MQDIMKELKELRDKAVRYENLKERYTDYAVRIEKAVEELNSVLKEIRPSFGITKTCFNYSGVIEELFDKLRSGAYISTDFIRATYPDLKSNHIQVVTNKLRTLKGVLVRKKGVKLEFYIDKEV